MIGEVNPSGAGLDLICWQENEGSRIFPFKDILLPITLSCRTTGTAVPDQALSVPPRTAGKRFGVKDCRTHFLPPIFYQPASEGMGEVNPSGAGLDLIYWQENEGSRIFLFKDILLPITLSCRTTGTSLQDQPLSVPPRTGGKRFGVKDCRTHFLPPHPLPACFSRDGGGQRIFCPQSSGDPLRVSGGGASGSGAAAEEAEHLPAEGKSIGLRLGLSWGRRGERKSQRESQRTGTG